MVLIGNVINRSGGKGKGRKQKNITLVNLFIISGTGEQFIPDGSNTAGMEKCSSGLGMMAAGDNASTLNRQSNTKGCGRNVFSNREIIDITP